MAFIKLIDFENADGTLKSEYEKGIKRAGRVYNILKITFRSTYVPPNHHISIEILPLILHSQN